MIILNLLSKINVYVNFFSQVKNIYGHFFRSPEGHKEYFLKLDSYLYKKNELHVIMKVRYKRTVDIISIKELLKDKDYLLELHPLTHLL